MKYLLVWTTGLTLKWMGMCARVRVCVCVCEGGGGGGGSI